MFVYWAVGSCLLVFLVVIVSLVMSGKLRAVTAVVDRQTTELEALSGRVRELESRLQSQSRPSAAAPSAEVP